MNINRTLLILSVLVLTNTDCLGEDAVEHGLKMVLPAEWLPLRLDSEFNGVAAYCDEGQVEILIERRPFDETARVSELKKQMLPGSVKKRS